MRVLVTGSDGKVGAAVTARLAADGHEVTAVDLAPPLHEADPPGAPTYVRADLSDAGDAFAVVAGARPEAVVHAAAIPDPLHDPPSRVLLGNLSALLHVVEACVHLGVPRLVNVSSETVPGFMFAATQGVEDAPDELPLDESHAVRPVDPYALGKSFGEQLCQAAVRRAPGLSVVTVRPSWVVWEGNAERNLGPLVADAEEVTESAGAYVDVYDLADLLARAATADLSGYHLVYGASPDRAGGHELAAGVRARYGDRVRVRQDLPRPDASSIDCSAARDLLGWDPRRTWRDYLDDEGRAHADLSVPDRPGAAPAPRGTSRPDASPGGTA